MTQAGHHSMMGGKKAPYTKMVEYINSTGGAYINTDKLIQPTNIVYLDLQYNTTRPPDNLAMQNGFWDTASGQPYLVFTSQSNTFYGYSSNYRTNDCKAGRSNTNRHTVKFDLAGDAFYLDGIKAADFGAGIEKVATVPFFLFARNLRGSGAQHYCSEKLYEFYIENNGEKTMHLVPVVDLDGQARMFDLVSGTYPAHYGTFTAGPDVN